MSPSSTFDPSGLVDSLCTGFRLAAAHVVPWFLSQMPAPYFRDTDAATVEAHLRALIAARTSDQPLSLTIQSRDKSEWTFISEGDRTGLLASLIRRLPDDRALRAAKVHTARDGTLVLDVFSFQPPSKAVSEDRLRSAREAAVVYAREQLPEVASADVERHLAERCSADYVLGVSPRRMCAHLRLFQQVHGSDDVVVQLEDVSSAPELARVTIAAGNASPRDLLERTARYLSARDVNIRRAHLETVSDGSPGGAVALLTFIIRRPGDGELPLDHPRWTGIRRALRRLIWLDERVLDRSFGPDPSFDLRQGEVLVALCDLVHQRLCSVDPFRFARDRVHRLAFRATGPAVALADLLIARFATADSPDFEAALEAIRAEVRRSVDHPEARRVLYALADAVAATQRCNVDAEARYALALRLDPAFLHAEDAEPRDVPYGVFFMSGRGFAGFHVRFRDIARGGLRVVRPRGVDAHAQESERLYAEAYDLAFAQQLKNKDIPEGGAKGVILAAPGAPTERLVKAYGDSLLDLLVAPVGVAARELVYLGPDENLTDALIEWLVARAKVRGYPVPNAFMSSKPGAGINHKRYGVTSEGVTVFVEAALLAVGIDPRRERFTVKMTGGPDGDVAGNGIRIMHREFGEHLRIVGIADGSGSAEDPDGLPMPELLRLVEASLPIDQLNPARLGPRGRVLALDAPNGLVARNSLHYRVVADAFVPCGGRPATMSHHNWRAFLLPDGTPSARVIVEGANLFVTELARAGLAEEAGVLVVKDSSANKCGVICSSFEIAASMLLEPAAFLRIKDVFVAEVLERLRRLARQEAELLFRARPRRPDRTLSALSVEISEVINRATDAIVERVDDLRETDHEEAMALVVGHLPPSLAEAAGADAIRALPAAYLRRAVASTLAADMVYREGMSFFVDRGEAEVGDLAVRYMRRARETRRLVAELRDSGLASRDEIIDLLERAGTRAGLAE